MRNKGLIIASAVVVGVMLLSSLAAGLVLPPGVQVAVHWNALGRADGFGGKWQGLFMMPGLATLVAALFASLPSIEPSRDGLARSMPLFQGGWIAMLGVLSLLHALVLLTALGWNLPVSSLVLGGTGAMFVVLGNQLPKSRRMYLVGIRTPWTLADEDVWIATHRLGGKLMVACGLLMWVLALLRPNLGIAAPLVIAVVVAVTLVPIIYSYLLWRRKLPRG